MDRIAGRFARVEPRRRIRHLVLGLLADLPRKNCWTIAEWAGEATPDAMQHLLSRAKWDADAVRDDLRAYVVEHLRDDQAVLVIDETGDVKKGRHTVGVQRQYTGTAGRIENSQVAVYLAYAGLRGHAALDRELYLPRSWTDQPDRCRAAGLAPDTAWPQTRSTAATPHCVPPWRKAPPDTFSRSPAPTRSPPGPGSSARTPWPRSFPSAAWQKLSAGAGAKGHRFYDWAHIDLPSTAPGHRHLLIRRNRTTDELAYYRCYSPQPVPLTALVRVAGSRWRVEETFQSGKGLAGLDEHQFRRYTSWSRWVTLAMLAHAFLAVVRADEHRLRPGLDDLIPLTCNEIQRLFIALVARPVHEAGHWLHWSHWRRRHQARSQASHYRRQAATQA
ncbi:IS701 family transposase ISSav2 [Streptomyces sp. RB17]|nr:IS701 family transposase ISSav2 [Streptomyces sp. RB17]